MKLFCPKCDAEGYKPFDLANSSGIELSIETAVPQTGNGFVGKDRSRSEPACSSPAMKWTAEVQQRP